MRFVFQRRGAKQGITSFTSVGAIAAIVVCLAFATATLADPLPGQQLKFQQKPLDGIVPVVGGPAYWGHDELSTVTRTAAAAPYQGVFMADDFADRFNERIVHVTWWGSYLENQRFSGVRKFLIAFESDVPAPTTGGGFSHPGIPLLSQVVTLGPLAPGSGTYTEAPVSPGGPPLGETLYKYNAELKIPFPQQANTVYWLKIAALVEPQIDNQIRWGWHDRDYTSMDPLASTAPLVVPGERDQAAGSVFSPVWHFQDNAVSGNLITGIDAADNVQFVDQTNYAPQHYLDFIDGRQGISQFSKDLAFELYYVPEPAGTLVLAAAGALTFARRRSAGR